MSAEQVSLMVVNFILQFGRTSKFACWISFRSPFSNFVPQGSFWANRFAICVPLALRNEETKGLMPLSLRPVTKIHVII